MEKVQAQDHLGYVTEDQLDHDRALCLCSYHCMAADSRDFDNTVTEVDQGVKNPNIKLDLGEVA